MTMHGSCLLLLFATAIGASASEVCKRNTCFPYLQNAQHSSIATTQIILVQLRQPPHLLTTRHDDLHHHTTLMHSHNIHAFRYHPPRNNQSKTHHDKLTELLNDPAVAHAELDHVVHLAQGGGGTPPQLLPNDPQVALQYGLVNVKAPFAWVNSTGSASVRVCVLDTGVWGVGKCMGIPAGVHDYVWWSMLCVS